MVISNGGEMLRQSKQLMKKCDPLECYKNKFTICYGEYF